MNVNNVDALDKLFEYNPTLYVNALVEFTDDKSQGTFVIGIGEYDESQDNDVFYWCDSLADLKSLFNGVNDFKVIEFDAE